MAMCKSCANRSHWLNSDSIVFVLFGKGILPRLLARVISELIFTAPAVPSDFSAFILVVVRFLSRAWVVNSVTIKSVELTDLDEAIVLFDAQLREHNIITPKDDLHNVARAVIADPSTGFLLLALAEAAPVGVAYAASHLSLEHGGRVGWLEELYVLPEKRGYGIGSQLLSQTIARAGALQWRSVELEVVAGHERTVPLYRRHAFQPLSRSRFSRIVSE